MAEDLDVDGEPVWTLQLDRVERLFSDEPERDGENVFAMTFEPSGQDAIRRPAE